MALDIVLGVDLGSSFSTAAAWVRGKLYLAQDNRGEATVPSVVYYPAEGSPVVGAYADRMRTVDPANCIAGVKRVLGRARDSAEGRIFEAQSTVTLRTAHSGIPILETRQGQATPQQVAAEIFRALREMAEKRFQTPIEKAVVTIPASATPESEEATVSAARQAGLTVLRTLTEPTAGALAYGVDQEPGERILLVYDFGGGTFDVTVLSQSSEGFRTLSVAGDSCLGGDDIDHALAQYAAGHVWARYQVDLTRDLVGWSRVVREAELVKRALSARESAPFRVRDAFSSIQRRRDLDLVVERNTVEAHWMPLVERSMRVTAEAMLRAQLRPSMLDRILLVGGTTYLPLVRSTLHRILGQPGVVVGDPQTAVAAGAALMGTRCVTRAA